MFGKKKEKATKKIDNLVTGIIIGSAVASIFGLSQTKKGKEVTSGISKKSKGVFGLLYELIGKIMGKIIGGCKTKKK